MYRVAFPLLMVFALAGCSMGTANITSGFAGPVQTSSIKPKLPYSRSLGGLPRSHARRHNRKSGRSTAGGRRRLASLGHDAAPAGSFKKARRGSGRSRNYHNVHLDMEKARKLINDYRRSRGLKPLKLDAQLTNAAKAHSRDLARWDRISHYGSDGSSPWDRVKRAGFNAKLAAENVGTGQNSIDEVFKDWQKSPGHNKNLLLADAESMGIALVNDPKTEFKTFWTLVIGTRL